VNTNTTTLSVKAHVSHHIILITACAQNVRLQHDVDADADSMFNNRMTQTVAYSLLMCCFSSSTRRPRLLWYTIDSFLKHTPRSWAWVEIYFRFLQKNLYETTYASMTIVN